MRDPSSLPMMTDVSCYGDGQKNRRCYPKNQGAVCDADNVGTFACDLRNLKVPPYYVPTDTTATFAAYRQLPIAQQMYAQLVAARRSFMKAFPILCTYSREVLTNHLLPFKGGSEDEAPQTLIPVNNIGQNPVTWVTLIYPNANSASQVLHIFDIGNTEDVNNGVGTVQDFRRILNEIIRQYGNEAKDENQTRRRFPSLTSQPGTYTTRLSMGKLLADIVDGTDRPEDNGATIIQSIPIYSSTMNIANVTYLVNGPFWRVEQNVVVANPKYINARYRTQPQNYYRTGRGMLLSAFEHLRAATLLFLQIRNTQQTGTFNVLEDYEYNMLLMAARMLQYCNLVGLPGWSEYYADQTSKKLFKGKILRFRSTGDWLVYHVFVELLTQQAEIFKGQNKAMRRLKKKTVYALPGEQLNVRGRQKAHPINVDLGMVQGGANVFLIS